MADFLQGLSMVMGLECLLYIVLGTLLGVVVGAIPGINGTVATALLLPIGYVLSPVVAISFMVAIYVGSEQGCSISAILFNVPGTSSACATALDGYPLAQKGRAGDALAGALYGSAVGGIFGSLVALLLSPPLAKLALRFGPAEMFGVAFFGLILFGLLAEEGEGSLIGIIKGVMSGLIGILIGTVGCFDMTPRFTGGNLLLYNGFDLMWVIIGLFVFSEAISLTLNKRVETTAISTVTKFSHVKCFWEMWKMKWDLLWACVIGTIIGIIPGAGATLASWVSYGEAKRRLNDKGDCRFGEGRIEGVIACEAANNSVVGGALIPTLTLGIPGSSNMAVVMSALMIVGLRPGFQLFRDFGPQVYAIILSSILAVFVFALIGIVYIPHSNKLLLIPTGLLCPSLVVMGTIGAFSAMNNHFGAYVAFAFGFLGYILKELKFSVPGLLLGFILSPLLENNLDRVSFLARAENVNVIQYLLNKPITIALLAVTTLAIIMTVKKNLSGKTVKNKTV